MDMRCSRRLSECLPKVSITCSCTMVLRSRSQISIGIEYDIAQGWKVATMLAKRRMSASSLFARLGSPEVTEAEFAQKIL